jgi:tripartite-type tricarboxylate transporter receptor subunit TctC
VVRVARATRGAAGRRGDAVQQKDVQAKLEAAAAEAIGSSPEQFGDYLKAQVEKYRKLVRDIKLPVE